MRTPMLLSASICLCVAAACSRDDAPAAPTTAAPDATAAAAANAAPAPQERVFIPEELDQMLAPIALYPDSLLAQVLMAATYPGDVADAVKWSKANPDAKGDPAIVQVQNQPWDPSVQSLVAFPQVLAMLGQDPPWVQRLGDAFLAQPEDVMDSVQRLRRKAQDAGTLASNEHMSVTSQPAAEPPPPPPPPPAEGAEPIYDDAAYAAGTDTTIIIEPASETVYVPAYDPGTAYGAWAYPSYPPTYYPPAYGWYPGQALWTGLAFGAGIAIADGLWGDADWDGGDIDIDVDRYNNINVNDIDRNSNRWEHNAGNRDGTPYRDQRSRENHGNRLAGSEGRDQFRGDDAGRAQARDEARRTAEQRGRGDGARPGQADGRDRSREQARQSMADRGMDTPARTAGEARDRAATAGREQPGLADRGGAGDRYGSGDRAGGRGGGTYGDAAAMGDRATPTDRGAGRGGSFSTVGSAESRAAGQRYQQRQDSNRQARDSARSSQQQRSRNDAFSGASRPQQSRQSYDRGRQSHASSRDRGGSSRSSAGRQTQRSAPSRSGGGRSSGGRSGGGRRG